MLCFEPRGPFDNADLVRAICPDYVTLDANLAQQRVLVTPSWLSQIDGLWRFA